MFLHMLPDLGMNYTFNRPLLDGTSPARLKELGAVAPRIKDYEFWCAVWLEVARKAEAEKRYLDAASYYHGAEFYLPAGDVRNGLYDDFARNWALGIKGVAGYERIAIPYPGGHLPGFRLQAKGKERSTLIFTGGNDLFVEEFYNFLLPLTALGITVIAFDGPGQGAPCGRGFIMTTHGEAGQGGYRLLKARCGGLAGRLLRRIHVDTRRGVRASHQAHHLHADVVFGSRHDAGADATRQGAGADLSVQGRRPQGNRGRRRPGAPAELHLRMVRRPRDAYHRDQDAVRFPYGDCAALAQRNPA